jgi:hypothetical protein
MIYIILAAIPVAANILCRTRSVAFVTSALLGVSVLWANMVVLEVHAADSDIDLVFGIACVLWACSLIFAYGITCVLFALFERMTRKNKERGGNV